MRFWQMHRKREILEFIEENGRGRSKELFNRFIEWRKEKDLGGEICYATFVNLAKSLVEQGKLGKDVISHKQVFYEPISTTSFEAKLFHFSEELEKLLDVHERTDDLHVIFEIKNRKSLNPEQLQKELSKRFSVIKKLIILSHRLIYHNVPRLQTTFEDADEFVENSYVGVFEELGIEIKTTKGDLGVSNKRPPLKAVVRHWERFDFSQEYGLKECIEP